MNKIISLAGIGVVILFIALIFIFNSSEPTKNPQTQRATETSTSTQSAVIATSTYSLADIATHASESSCWSAIHSEVYDFTDFIKKHPGGARAVLKLCGTDGTKGFDSAHAGQKRALETLSRYKIGTLK